MGIMGGRHLATSGMDGLETHGAATSRPPWTPIPVDDAVPAGNRPALFNRRLLLELDGSVP